MLILQEQNCGQEILGKIVLEMVFMRGLSAAATNAIICFVVLILCGKIGVEHVTILIATEIKSFISKI